MELERDPAHILLIEDNPADVLLLREACNSEGLDYRFTTLPDAEEALAFVRRQGKYADAETPNLVLLDMNIPKGDGVEILEEIRSNTHLSGVPVVILTSSDAPMPKDREVVAKATCFFTKPPSLDEFMMLGKQIRSILENGRPLSHA